MRTVFVCLGVATLVSGKVYFSETFDDDWESRWVNSQWQKDVGAQGSFSLATGKFHKRTWENDAWKEDRGLQTQWVKFPDKGYFWESSAAFDSFSNAGKELVVQYQVKYERDLTCGGGYIKLGPKMDQTNFSEHSAYNILFGPDKCGGLRSDRRTRLEFNYKGKMVAKRDHMEYKQETRGAISGAWDGISHLYRLVIKPDNTVQVSVDMEKIYEGRIRDGWEGFKIDDPEDLKPPDWIDDMMMSDPEDKMPDDWATESRIFDPAAEKPGDWDAEEDGEWEPPIIDNPAFKGEWVANRLYNTAYKGFWLAKRIENPEYAGDKEVYKFDDISYIGFDLWQQTGGAIFDNIIICDDVAEAEAFAAKWKTLNRHEKASKIAAEAKEKQDEEEANKREEAKLAAEAAKVAVVAARREEGRKKGFDDAKLDRLERAFERAKANEEHEARELVRKRDEEDSGTNAEEDLKMIKANDKKLIGDETGKIQQARIRRLGRREDNAGARKRAREEMEDNIKEEESRGNLIPPEEKEVAKKELEAKKAALEKEKAKIATAKAAIAKRAVAQEEAAEREEKAAIALRAIAMAAQKTEL